MATVKDTESVSALHEYVAALSHPITGIPCQVRIINVKSIWIAQMFFDTQELVSGIKIFTGSSAAHWFIKNMEGVSSMQNAQVKIFPPA